MRKLAWWLWGAGVALGWAGAVHGQVVGRYQVTATGGYTVWDRSSALKNSVAGGLDARYYFTERFGGGLYFHASRSNTDGTFFPLVRLDFGDTVLVYVVSQQVGAFDAGIQGFLRFPLGSRLALVGVGGIGIYSFSVDPQQSDFPRVPGTVERMFSGREYTVGAGAEWGLTGNTGLRLEVRDFIYTNYDRDRFNLSDPLLREENLPHPRLELPAKKSTIHSLRYAIGFTFVPGR